MAQASGSLGRTEPLLPPGTTSEPVARGRPRAYYLDWMGVGAIYIMVIYHAVHVLDSINFFKNVPGARTVLTVYKATSIQTGMPLLFYAYGNLEGVKRRGRSLCRTLFSRFRQLIVPLVLFYFACAPAIQWFSEEQKEDPDNPGIWHQKNNLVMWLFRCYSSVQIFHSLDPTWLWFLPALFGCELLGMPLFLAAERAPRGRDVWQVCASVVWLGLAALLVMCGFSWHFALYAVAGPICTALLAWAVPLPIPNKERPKPAWVAKCVIRAIKKRFGSTRDGEDAEYAWIAIRVAKVVQIACNVGLVTSFGYDGVSGISWQGGKCVIEPNTNIAYSDCVRSPDCHYEGSLYHGKRSYKELVPFTLLCVGFFVNGFFSQRWFAIAEHMDHIIDLPSVGFKFCRVLVFFFIALGIMATSTVGQVQTEHYLYPIYSNTYCKGPYFGALFVIGSWVFLGWICPLSRAYLNYIVDANLHRHARNSGLVVYGVHLLWLNVVVFWMVQPSIAYCNKPWSFLTILSLWHCPGDKSGYENPLAAVGILFLVIAVTLALSWATYALLFVLLSAPPFRGLGLLVGLVRRHRRQARPTAVVPDEGEEEKMPPSAGAGDGRQRDYFLDWLRVMAIYLVVVYHVVQALDWVSVFSNVPGAIWVVSSFRATSLQFGMPLFFYISGKSSGMGRKTKDFLVTFKARCLRLLVPFVIFYLAFIPAWQYIDQARDPEHPGFFHTLFNPCPHQDLGSDSWCNPVHWLFSYYTKWFFNKFDMAWLWFLPALFIVEVLSSPLFLFAERAPRGEDGWKPYCGAASVLWLGLAVLLVKCRFSLSFAFWAVAGPIFTALLAWIVPLPRDKSEGPQRAWIAIRVARVIQIACNVGLVTSFGYEDIDSQKGKCGISTNPNITYSQCMQHEDCKYEWPEHETISHDPRAGIPFILLCLCFFVQGFFSQRWYRSAKDVDGIDTPSRGLCGIPIFKCCRLLGWFLTVLGLIATSTLGEVETEHYIYPVYSNTYCKGPYFGALHVMGTWAFLSMIYPLAKACLNDKIEGELHHYASNSTVIVYAVHWLFLKIFVFWMVEPSIKYCKESWSFWGYIIPDDLKETWCPKPPGFESPAVTIVILLVVLASTLISSWATYWILLRIPCVGRPIDVKSPAPAEVPIAKKRLRFFRCCCPAPAEVPTAPA